MCTVARPLYYGNFYASSLNPPLLTHTHAHMHACTNTHAHMHACTNTHTHLSASKPGSSAVQLTLMAVRKGLRCIGVGRYLMQV